MHVHPFSSVILTRSNMGVTYSLDACSPILMSGSDLVKHVRDSHPGHVFTHSSQWFRYGQTQKSNSLPGCMFTHSSQWCSSAQGLESNSLSAWMFTHFSVALICWNIESDLQSGCVFIQPLLSVILICSHMSDLQPACSVTLVSSSDLLNSRRATHILDVFQYLISKPHSHLLESYQFAL